MGKMTFRASSIDRISALMALPAGRGADGVGRCAFFLAAAAFAVGVSARAASVFATMALTSSRDGRSSSTGLGSAAFWLASTAERARL
ncbi:hypothetical protein D3C71_2017650 [compost metagenome]